MKVEKFDLNDGITSLYRISLEYYTLLKKKDHPKIELITIIMDKLIELKKDKDISPETMKEKYDIIHSLAYSNIQTIYDYDKEQLELNCEKIEVMPLDIHIKLNDEKNDEKNDDQVSRVNSIELDQHENIKFTHSIQ